ncbi:unnamed protein product [Musa banksii]
MKLLLEFEIYKGQLLAAIYRLSVGTPSDGEDARGRRFGHCGRVPAMWCRPFRFLLCPMLRVVVWYLRTSTYPSSHTPLHQALVLRWEEIDSPQEIRASENRVGCKLGSMVVHDNSVLLHRAI